MRGMHMHGMNRLFFFFMRPGHRGKTGRYKKWEAAMDAANRTPEVQRFWKELREIQNARANHVAGGGDAGSSAAAVAGGNPIPERPQDQRPDSAGAGSSGADGSNPTLTGSFANWQTLEKRLQEIVRDNPDISEVELNGDVDV